MMKTLSKSTASLAVYAFTLFVAASLVACSESPTTGAKGEKTWASEIVEHKNFKDLGNYVIELPDFNDPSVEPIGLAVLNAMGDNGELPKPGCTAMVKKNNQGEVIFGRNMDLDISQKPAYVYTTSYGKYKNFCVVYSPGLYKNYADLQQMDAIDNTTMAGFLFVATDCLNEKGLYIEMNLREQSGKHLCYGMHSAYGEKTRDDGKPWSELRANTVAVPQLVSQNCATVKEAVAFLKNSYDWYTFSPAPGANLGVGQNNMAFLIGDATGEYGLIEIAQDEVRYIPYQYGHANFYINPKWVVLETVGAGIGRLEMVSQVIDGPQTLEEAMDAMKPIMWRNETLWLGQSHRLTDEPYQHPYNQIIFEDDKGNPSLDWRSEYVALGTVLDDDRMLLDGQVYEDARKSGYDPKIKEYIDDAIKAGCLIVDNGSIKFNVKGQQLTLTQLREKYNAYLLCVDAEKKAALQPYYAQYRHLAKNMNNLWIHDDHNFEAMKAFAYARIHIRYNDKGEFDPDSMSKYEKLCAFYGMGTEKDEKPLRDDASIWTTSLNVGANCAKKEMKIRFWENDEVIYHAKF